MKKVIIVVQLVAVLISCKKKEEVVPEVEACFTANKEIILIGQQIQFDNCSENAAEYEWNFGDGEQSEIRNPSHQFDLSGNYEVTLTSYSTVDGSFEEFSKNVIVNQVVLKAVYIKPVVEGRNVQVAIFNNEFGNYIYGQRDNNNDSIIYRYKAFNRLRDYVLVDYYEYQTTSLQVEKSFNIYLKDYIGEVGDESFTYIDEEGFEITFEYELV